MNFKELIEQNPNKSPLKIAVEHFMRVKGWGLKSEKEFMEKSILLQDFVEEVNYLVKQINEK